MGSTKDSACVYRCCSTAIGHRCPETSESDSSHVWFCSKHSEDAVREAAMTLELHCAIPGCRRSIPFRKSAVHLEYLCSEHIAFGRERLSAQLKDVKQGDARITHPLDNAPSRHRTAKERIDEFTTALFENFPDGVPQFALGYFAQWCVGVHALQAANAGECTAHHALEVLKESLLTAPRKS